MNMRKFFCFLFFIAFYPVSAEKLTFYAEGFSGRVEPVPVSIEWNLGWFEESSFAYNHDLARISALLADLAYSDVAGNPEDNNLLAAYKNLGVADADIEMFYNVDYSDPLWGNDQCAFSFASRSLPNGKKLLFVTVRGTPGNSNEWLSNLNVMNQSWENSVLHEGFSKTSLRVYTKLLTYLVSHKMNPAETAVVITGHSRGAAVANLLGASLRETKLFNLERVYVYTFAAPNVTTSKINTEEGYDYIWNIVNGEDLVPSVPFNIAQWQYRKFGHILTLINNWNVDSDFYNNDALPRMNAVYEQFSGHEFHPFTFGPFLPIQLAMVVNAVSENIKIFYNGKLNLHKRAEAMIYKLFPVLDKSGVKKEEKEEDVDKNQTLDDKKSESLLEHWLNTFGGDGFADYVETAAVDMHSYDAYLSWMLAMDEGEVFSDVGCKQLIISGSANMAVLSMDGEILARIDEGHIVYSSLKGNSQICARQLSPDKVVMGIAGTSNVDIVIVETSLFPSKVSLTLEQYTSDGRRISVSEPQKFYSRRGTVYHFFAGTLIFDGQQFVVEKLDKKTGKRLEKEAGLHSDFTFSFTPEFGMDTCRDAFLGARFGCRNIFGTAQIASDFSRNLIASVGFGTQQKLFWRVLFDIQADANAIQIFKNDNEVKFFPDLQVGLSYRFWRKAQIFASCSFDMSIKDFNDDAFTSSARRNTFCNFSINDSVSIYPRVRFGIRI